MIVTTLLIVVIITAGIILLTRTRQKETKPSPTTWPETSPATFPTSLSGPTLPAMRTPRNTLMWFKGSTSTEKVKETAEETVRRGFHISFPEK